MGTKMDPAGESESFAVTSAALHDAVICEFEDLGMVDEEFEGKKAQRHKGRWIFQVAERDEEGRRKEVSFKFNMTWGKEGWPSKLRKTMEKWVGQPLTKEQMDKFEAESVIGKPCRVSVAHIQTSDGPRAYVDAIFKPGDVKLKPENYETRASRKAKKGSGAPASTAAGDDPFAAEPASEPGGDEVPF